MDLRKLDLFYSFSVEHKEILDTGVAVRFMEQAQKVICPRRLVCLLAGSLSLKLPEAQPKPVAPQESV